MRPVVVLLVSFSSLLFIGCGNACQQLCDVASGVYDKCERSYDAAELSECRSRYISPDADTLASCEYGLLTDRDGVTNFEKDVSCEELVDLDATFGNTDG